VDDQQGALVLKRKLAGNKEWLFAVNLGESFLQIETDPSCQLVKLPGMLGAELKKNLLRVDPDSCALITL